MYVIQPRSQARGALAGVVATAIGIPCLAAGLVAGVILQRTALAKLLGHDISETSMAYGGTHLMANTVLAALIGGIAAGLAAMIALKLIRNAAAGAFVAVSAIGALALAGGMWRWLSPHASGHPIGLATLIGVGWLAAVLMVFVATQMANDEAAPES